MGHWKKDCRSLTGEGNKTNQSSNVAIEVQDALMMSEDVSNEMTQDLQIVIVEYDMKSAKVIEWSRWDHPPSV